MVHLQHALLLSVQESNWNPFKLQHALAINYLEHLREQQVLTNSVTVRSSRRGLISHFFFFFFEFLNF